MLNVVIISRVRHSKAANHVRARAIDPVGAVWTNGAPDGVIRFRSHGRDPTVRDVGVPDGPPEPVVIVLVVVHHCEKPILFQHANLVEMVIETAFLTEPKGETHQHELVRGQSRVPYPHRAASTAADVRCNLDTDPTLVHDLVHDLVPEGLFAVAILQAHRDVAFDNRGCDVDDADMMVLRGWVEAQPEGAQQRDSVPDVATHIAFHSLAGGRHIPDARAMNAFLPPHPLDPETVRHKWPSSPPQARCPLGRYTQR